MAVGAAALVLGVTVPAAADQSGTHVRCCFDVEIHATFELDNTWSDPPTDFTGPTSHGFLVRWIGEGVYEYGEKAGKPFLKPVGAKPRLAAYLYDHDAGAATGTCLRSLSTSGDVTTWERHWLPARTTLLHIGPGKLAIAAGAPFAGHLATCGGTFAEDVHADTSAAKYGLQGPWSYAGKSPLRAQLRKGSQFVTNAYTRNVFTQLHGTPPHETDGHSNVILTFEWFRPAKLESHVRSFNNHFPLDSRGFVSAR